jgi:S-formylglutathione hydrolase FrmB
MPLDLVHATVAGRDIEMVHVEHAEGGAMTEPFVALSGEPRKPGKYTLSFKVDAGAAAVEVPPCAGREDVRVDGRASRPEKGAFIADVDPKAAHTVEVDIKVSGYEKRIRCAYSPISGARATSTVGLVRVSFTSPNARAGGGRAVLYIPRRYAAGTPMPLLVGVHPWNGDEWTYANYTELLDQAEKRGVILLMPNGLGNSLYVARAESEVMLALDETTKALSVDTSRVSIWGASMGGQGATTIGWHHPDRFASVTSFFGDARFDTATYVKNILPTEEAAHAVNPLDVAENARHQKVLLVHGEDDHTSLIHESELLDQGLEKLGYDVTFVRHPRMGHEAPMIILHVKDFVALAAETSIPRAPARVTFRSVRAEDTSAYGITIERAHAGDAFIDMARGDDGSVRVSSSTNVKAVSIAEGAFGGAHAERRVIK